MPLAAVRVKPRLPRAYLSFDGVDDYVNLSDTGAEWDFQSAITVELHAKVASIPRDTSRFFCGEGGKFRIGVYPNQSIHFWLMDAKGTVHSILTGTKINAGTWYHIAGVYDGAKQRVYVNSAEDSNVLSWSGLLKEGNNNQAVGAGFVGSATYLNGSIALVRIYNRALAQAEIRHNMYRWGSPVKDGLVLWLAEDTINPPTWNDKSGCGNDGTIYGAVKVERPHKAVRVNSAARVLAAVR